MGRYASQASIVPRLLTERLVAQLTLDDALATTITAEALEVLESVIEDAEAEVDSRLAVRYALPLAEVPALVAQLASRITRYRLYTMRGGDIEEWLKSDYANDVKTLEGIAAGRVELGLTAAGADPAVSPNPARRVRVTSTTPTFGRDNLGDF